MIIKGMVVKVFVMNDNIKTPTTIFSGLKVIEIYDMTDEFCKEFAF